MQNFRLESGKKLWQALWEFRHPDTECFTSPVSPLKYPFAFSASKIGYATRWRWELVETYIVQFFTNFPNLASKLTSEVASQSTRAGLKLRFWVFELASKHQSCFWRQFWNLSFAVSDKIQWFWFSKDIQIAYHKFHFMSDVWCTNYITFSWCWQGKIKIRMKEIMTIRHFVDFVMIWQWVESGPIPNFE